MTWSAAKTISWISHRKPADLKDWTNDMWPETKSAQKDLTAAIADGRVRAQGRKADDPHGLLEPIPSDPFRVPGVPVVVGVHGDMTSPPSKRYKGPHWRDIEFDSAQIQKEWPPPPPVAAQDWMLTEARHLHATGKIGKKDDMVTRCRKAVGCSRDEAQAAYALLPEGLRLKRGAPRGTKS
jgi:hypothetical protein